MNRRKKRKPDFRRIRPSQTYSIAELASAIQRSPATVRAWLRQGMPTVDSLKPTVIDGAQAKEWLRRKWASRKAKAGGNEAHCLRCRGPRAFAEGSRSLRRITVKVLAISGTCAVCGCRTNKFASAQSVAILERQNARKRGRSVA